MGREVRGVPEVASLSPAPSIGRYLAGQRRLRGISLDELATRTKIPKRSLERLEAGAFDQVADGFSRSFVRTVAGALGLDPDDAVMRLLSEPADAEGGTEGRPRLARSAWLPLTLLAVATAALGLGLWRLAAGPPESAADRDVSEVVTRRDAVRALAESQSPEREP